MRLKEKQKAILLRKKGFSYKSIQQHIPVSRSTLSVWLRDIELTELQRSELLNAKFLGQYKGSQTQHLKRLKKIEMISLESKEELIYLLKNPLFLIGLSLYWAEGDKHKKEMVKFTNADPSMISLMMKWFREICQVPEEKFRISLHSHTLFVEKNIKSYWSYITRIPENQFYKTYIKKTSLGLRKNILYNGTCAIRVNSVDLFRRIIGWKEALLIHLEISPRSSMDRTKDF